METYRARLSNLRKGKMQALATGTCKKDFRAEVTSTDSLSHMYIYDIIYN